MKKSFLLLFLFFLFLILLKNSTIATDVEKPTYSLNSTNSTLAGQPTLFSLKWQDNVGLSGYIFAFCNGTWNGSYCAPTNWLEGWQYRKSHVIINATGAGTNYQVRILVWNTTGTDSGENVYVGSKVRTDFGDVRFTRSDGTTLLDYWIESINATAAIFWVKITDDLSANNVTIYIYYGKSNTTTTSNYTSVFPLKNHDFSFGNDTSPFDLCTNSYSTLDDWMVYCKDRGKGEGPEKRDDSYSIPGHDGYAYISADAFFCHFRGMYQIFDVTNVSDFAFSFWSRSPRIYGGSCTVCGISASCGRDYVSIEFLNSTNDSLGEHIFWNVFGGLTNEQIEQYCETPTKNYTQLTGGDTWTYYSFQGIIPPGINKTNIKKVKVKTHIYTCGGRAYHRWDDFIIRKYVYPEPGHGSWGAEETGTGWINDTWTAFTAEMCSSPYTECWSNVTKVINSTVGAKIAWKVYTNDTNNNWNVSQEFSFTVQGILTCEAGGPYSKNSKVLVVGTSVPGESELNVEIRKTSLIVQTKTVTSGLEGKYSAEFTGLDEGMYSVYVYNPSIGINCTDTFEIKETIACEEKVIYLNGIAQDFKTGKLLPSGTVKVFVKETQDSKETQINNGYWSLQFPTCMEPGKRYTLIIITTDSQGRSSWNKINYITP